MEKLLVMEEKKEGSYKYEEFDNVEKVEGEGDGDGDGQMGKTIVISLKNEGEGFKA